MLLSIIEFSGRFHPLLVHLPIGILLIGLLLQWLSLNKKYSFLQPAIPIILLAGAVSAAFSCLTGYLLSLSGDYEEGLVNWHMWMGIAVALVAILLYFKSAKKDIGRVYKASSIGLFVLISATGHLGGSLTHGSDYLTSAWNKETDSLIFQPKVIPDVQQALVYADIIQPILQEKCYKCHGSNKQKGNFRMDTPELLMKGGKKGAEIISGKADESELIKRLLLPEEDEHHMAPKDKPQLTEKQVALMHWWIQEGTDFTKKVNQINQSEKMKLILLSLQSDKALKKLPPSIPVTPVDKANEQAIQKLKDAGAVVIPVAQNSNYLAVNFVTAPNAGDKEVSLLLGIKKQLVWLKLGSTKITDAALKTLSECINLTQLQLNYTAVSDKGLNSLKALTNLQTLNLANTKITKAGLKELHDLTQLQTLYLYQTAVDMQDWKELEKMFPKTVLDSGGYNVPTLVGDTTEVK
ncbi:MAG: c-type cytochrome domain-containing protein [Sphingobacteriaceae bacterium]